VQLHPSRIEDNGEGARRWDIEATIEADCQHRHDHGGLETVWDRGDRQVATPDQAGAELLAAAKQLHDLGRQHSLDHWLAMVSD
jgi:hypothetical protein